MEKRWEIAASPDEKLTESLSRALNVNHDLAALLINRGITAFDEAKHFFRPDINSLHDPFLMKDMDRAVNRLTEAIAADEKILIYGDYDVDGTTSVSLMMLFLQKLISDIEYYIPDRYSEGYGLSEKGIRWAAENEFSLIISLDCGIKAVDKAELSKELGIDLIICDHHLPGEQLPDAYAVLDPKRKDCKYPYKELCGCGVGFKLLQGLCLQQSIPFEKLFDIIDLVAVSIASDIVPITGENRTLAYYGLKKLNTSPLPGLLELMAVAGKKPPLTISDIVFYVGPRINAAGRLTHAKESVRLLICDDEKVIKSFSDQLNQTNLDRRTFDHAITEEALDLIANNSEVDSLKSTVLFKEDWHKGVIGIVASRCMESYYRPTIILTQSNGKATGSARSVEGFDIYQAIDACGDLLEQYGGHTHAAGLTMSIENIPAFRKRFEEYVQKNILPEQQQPKIEIDRKVNFPFVNFKTLNILKQMAPFGPHNMQPIFVTEDVILAAPARVLKDTHLKLQVRQADNPKVLDAIGFGMANHAMALDKGAPFRLAYQIVENNYMGNKSLQLMIKDIKYYG
ncbi:MAG: single-stranded-DNA-specific exonuclease RecJ [Cyclobacteriaceae bacterium]